MNTFGGGMIDYALLPVYKTYLFAKWQLGKIYTPSGNWFWDIVTHRYIIHGIIIFLGIIVTTNNLQARAAGFHDENFGKQSILYALVGEDNLEVVEETADIVLPNQPISYLGPQTGVRSTPSFFETNAGESASAVTQGGAAIVKPELSAMDEPASQVRSHEQAYTVQEGDTISSIAAKFGVSIYTILWENNLTERSYIRPGDSLVILPTTGVTHKVARGENLDTIAKKYGVDKDRVVEYNELIDEDAIRIGDEIFIPGGSKLPSYVPPAVAKTIRSYVGAPPASAAPSGTRLQWPTTTTKITQYFSWRHTGVDIASRQSPPIFAAEGGTVVRAQTSGWNGGYGHNIIIDHGNGLQTLYGHMATLFVTVGDTVTRGQTIGIMGNTGRSTGPHVHFEVRINGVRVNPLSYTK